MLNKIIFIDRDGTIIHEPEDNFQVDNINKLRFQKNVILALSQLRKLSYMLVMVTNQDGLGTQYFSKKNFYIVHNYMLKILESQNILFHGIYICPHYERENCLCRKPNIDMIKLYLNNLDKNNSYVIGDRIVDMDLAKNIGIQGIHYNQEMDWMDIVTQLTPIKRYSQVTRHTKETSIHTEIILDSNTNINKIDTGIHFFNHMLEQIAIHSGCTLNIQSQGDLYLDDHHLVEDTALTLGTALFRALGNKLGIQRFGFVLPMDESLAECALDLSGRPYLQYDAKFKFQKVGDLSTEMIKHFFYSLSYSMSSNIYLKVIGDNDHHKAESLFKVFGQTLKQAIRIINFTIPSSKGIIY
ncbi:bifunctional histidinol-phosphatase/imidazoleglycerol-phosphate dehydratase HisB [Enterobacteriaceae endosymbiont of Macroplea mutica]|uniref:bifunctional histidinol-phosphatase/imidazoleglycerol-phosphate dehydratase HisB n=1 Tax=Enterobacteriaceae endosymbiont of Macroplea mutica TaxID=2675791 RepID=UPI001449B07D|nr:bifunctional histidinol-phosphatase/imidazoleglycerol-phosphate dehydratase HisB [Enterobacteriaceae endosymbiont of Macroplea mutica]QJC31163.1 bifunctional histidinol-phosphatase/imidazoleglycerol-phosphate dehydratase HisB [Enterobacteriaceae endosymbiont of Macroplea mutica]